MPKIDVKVTTADGVAPAWLYVPDGAGPWPGVIMYPDAGGVRDVFFEMGARLSADGYVVLVPDVYYRAGDYEPFSVDTAFTDPAEQARMGSLSAMLTGPRVRQDASDFADFLEGRPEVKSGPIGTTGYCVGGRFSLIAAGVLGERVGAAASIHGGNLAVEDDADSPRHLAEQVRAVIYVGAAANDPYFGPDQEARLDEAYRAAGVEHAIEHYDAGHGFAVTDNPTYDPASAERHWAALAELYGTALA
jgi:carboxymethylenebutenolidase